MRVHIRGNPANLGDEAPRRFLAILSGDNAPPFTKGSGRLELAEAIASKDNPLTARVMVNRIWQHHFGQGLVRHAEQLRRAGRAADASRTARLSGQPVHRLGLVDQEAAPRNHAVGGVSAEQPVTTRSDAEIDPDNKLLWRMNRRRLEVEAVARRHAGRVRQTGPDHGRPVHRSRRRRTTAAARSTAPSAGTS